MKGILDAVTMRKRFELASAGDGNERYACIVSCPDRQSCGKTWVRSRKPDSLSTAFLQGVPNSCRMVV
jgi:hypothetical protein